MTLIVVFPVAALADLDLERVADFVLSEDERSRWHGLPGEGRRVEWLAGRLAAKQAIRRALAHPVASWPLGQIEILADEQGAPTSRLCGLGGPSVSISHADRFSVAAVSPLGFVGVDAEPIRSYDADAVRRMLTDREQHLTQFFLGGGSRAVPAMWTIKQACLKALGVGLDRPPTSVEVGLGPGLQVSIEAAYVPDARMAQAWVGCWDDHALAAVIVARPPLRAPAAVV